MTLVVQLILSYLLSHSNPVKEEAKQFIKDKLNGWQETIALVMFDAAWNAALAAAGKHTVSLSVEQADALANAHIEAHKQLLA